MGNLHQGHLSLINLAREHAERVVVSVFVNPTQFGEGEDYEDYPRTEERDLRRLKRENTDMLFNPDIELMYPFGTDAATSITVPLLTDEFCGSFRPGHFDGVTSVVSRLFSIVQPDVAVFGEKDYQQLLVVQRLAADLSLPIEIVGAPTQREDDGLAMSSRNINLTETEREIAPGLYATLSSTARQLIAGVRDYELLEQQAVASLEGLGFKPEYFNIRLAANLELPIPDSHELVILAAAHLGETRLIDNCVVRI
jgi:pantoate--beta-alanine ligase